MKKNITIPNMSLWCNWITRLATDQKIMGSSPIKDVSNERHTQQYFCLLFVLRTKGRGFESHHAGLLACSSVVRV